MSGPGLEASVVVGVSKVPWPGIEPERGCHIAMAAPRRCTVQYTRLSRRILSMVESDMQPGSKTLAMNVNVRETGKELRAVVLAKALCDGCIGSRGTRATAGRLETL